MKEFLGQLRVVVLLLVMIFMGGCKAVRTKAVEESPQSVPGYQVSSEGSVALEVPSESVAESRVPEHFFYHAKFRTSEGRFCCDFYGTDFPVSVYHFVNLARGQILSRDAVSATVSASGGYYDGQRFYRREAGKYIVTGHWDEDPEGGPDYRIAEEGLKLRARAGRIGYVQLHPGDNGAEILILSDDIVLFDGQYTFFGNCAPLEVIRSLSTSKSAILEGVDIVEGSRCDGSSEMLLLSDSEVFSGRIPVVEPSASGASGVPASEDGCVTNKEIEDEE